jgi:hypothetical protein
MDVDVLTEIVIDRPREEVAGIEWKDLARLKSMLEGGRRA